MDTFTLDIGRPYKCSASTIRTSMSTEPSAVTVHRSKSPNCFFVAGNVVPALIRYSFFIVLSFWQTAHYKANLPLCPLFFPHFPVPFYDPFYYFVNIVNDAFMPLVGAPQTLNFLIHLSWFGKKSYSFKHLVKPLP
jgi:hypothetical protein